MGIRTGLIGMTTALALLPAPGASAAAADTETPTLVSFAVVDTTLGGGDLLTVNYQFADDTSTALSFVDFEFTDPDGRKRALFAYAAPLAGTLTMVVPGDWVAGDYTLESVYAADVALNLVQYLRDGSTTVSPTGATGPTGHAYDLATGDLAVEARAPGAPATVTARAGDGSARVLWTAAPANGSPLTEYVVTVQPDGRELTVPAPAGSLRIDELSNGTTYTFTVRATNAIGTSPESLPSRPVTPATRPARVDRPRVAVKRQRVVVQWRAPQDGGSPLTGYRVILGGDTTRVPASRRTLHERLRPGRYRLRVVAVNDLGTGEASPVVTFRVRRGHWAS